jgi:hypothetical protein
MMLQLTGQYTRRRDGSATLTAGFQDSEPVPVGSSWECPEGVTFLRGTLRLERTTAGSGAGR